MTLDCSFLRAAGIVSINGTIDSIEKLNDRPRRMFISECNTVRTSTMTKMNSGEFCGRSVGQSLLCELVSRAPNLKFELLW